MQNSIILKGFHALSEPIRLQILELLKSGELCVCELSDLLNLKQSKLSFHLKTLKEAGLLRSRQEGKWIYYSLNLSQLVDLEQYLAEYRRFNSLLPIRHNIPLLSISEKKYEKINKDES